MTRVQLKDAEWEFVGPYLLIGEYGPYPEWLRRQFEGVIWWFKTVGSGGRCRRSSAPGRPSTTVLQVISFGVILRDTGCMATQIVERMVPDGLWELLQRVVPFAWGS